MQQAFGVPQIEKGIAVARRPRGRKPRYKSWISASVIDRLILGVMETLKGIVGVRLAIYVLANDSAVEKPAA